MATHDLPPSTSSPSTQPQTQTQKTTYRIGTRKSALAIWQAERVHTHLTRIAPNVTFTIAPAASLADRDQKTALYAFNAKSLWTGEFEEQLVAGHLDILVHSLKDMPTQLPAGCALGAACDRSERRDCVVMSSANAARGRRTLSDLPDGAKVGTSSVRRLAQLRRLFPSLKTDDMRGNINTRLAKLDDEKNGFDALILAAAGVQRIGLGDRVSSFLSLEVGWYGAIGQGALGVEIREGDESAKALCGLVMQGDEVRYPGSGNTVLGKGRMTFLEVLAERSLLRALEGGCSVPVGVETSWSEDGDTPMLTIDALVLSVDGQVKITDCVTLRVLSDEEAENAGLESARRLVEKGAGKVLEEIVLNRKIIAEGGGA